MKSRQPFQISRAISRLAFAIIAASTTSCVVVPPPTRVVVRPYHPHDVVVEADGYVAVLPGEAVIRFWHGERCWYYHGRYYRRHPHRQGYILIRS